MGRRGRKRKRGRGSKGRKPNKGPGFVGWLRYRGHVWVSVCEADTFEKCQNLLRKYESTGFDRNGDIVSRVVMVDGEHPAKR